TCQVEERGSGFRGKPSCHCTYDEEHRRVRPAPLDSVIRSGACGKAGARIPESLALFSTKCATCKEKTTIPWGFFSTRPKMWGVTNMQRLAAACGEFLRPPAQHRLACCGRFIQARNPGGIGGLEHRLRVFLDFLGDGPKRFNELVELRLASALGGFDHHGPGNDERK